MPVFLISDSFCVAAICYPGKNTDGRVRAKTLPVGFGSATAYWIASGIFLLLLELLFPFWLQRTSISQGAAYQRKVRTPFSHLWSSANEQSPGWLPV